MHDVKTVFVLGAGSHSPYGLPSGYDLRQIICENFVASNSYTEEVCKIAFKDRMDYMQDNIDKVVKFANEFKFSMMPYIDNFLACKQADEEYQRIGKAIIAYVFSELEGKKDFYIGYEIYNKFIRSSEANKKRCEDDWYHLFFSKLSDRAEMKWKSVVVTFNYDRYIDFALFNYYKYSFNYSIANDTEWDKAAYERMTNELALLHVYGKLGPFSWEKEQGLPFGGKKNLDQLREASAGLYVAEDARLNGLNKNVQAYIISEILDAERIVFLGYGFAKFNNDYIGLSQLKRNIQNEKLKEVWFTNIGLGKARREEIREMFTVTKDNQFAQKICPIQNNKEGQVYNCSALLKELY